MTEWLQANAVLLLIAFLLILVLRELAAIREHVSGMHADATEEGPNTFDDAIGLPRPPSGAVGRESPGRAP